MCEQIIPPVLGIVGWTCVLGSGRWKNFPFMPKAASLSSDFMDTKESDFQKACSMISTIHHVGCGIDTFGEVPYTLIFPAV